MRVLTNSAEFLKRCARILTIIFLMTSFLNCYATISYSAQQVEQLLNAHSWEDQNNEHIFIVGNRYFTYQDCQTNFFGWSCSKHYQSGQLVDYGRIDYRQDGFVLSTELMVTQFKIKSVVDGRLNLTGLVSCNGACDIHRSHDQWTSVSAKINTPLVDTIFDAAIYGDNAYIEQYTGDINQKNSQGNTALIYASASPFYQTVGLLLKKGANPNVISHEGKDGINDFSNGDTPLTLAVESGQSESVALLLNAGANVNFVGQKSGDVGSSALIDAAMNDDFDILKLLIEHGADVKALVHGGNNILELVMTRDSESTESGYTDNLRFVTYLVENAKFNINSVDGQGQTALAVAINSLLPKTVNYLLVHGANPNFQDAQKNTPLMWAMQQKTTGQDDVTLLCQTPKFLDIVNFLKENGVSFALKNDAGQDSFAVAKTTGCDVTAP